MGMHSNHINGQEMQTSKSSYTCRISRGPAHKQKAVIGKTTPESNA